VGSVRKLFVLLAVFAAVVIPASPAQGVLYGQPDNNEHSYVGVIRFFDEEGNYLWRCTGTLISPTVVLTAGHCTFGTAYAEAWFTETGPFNRRGPLRRRHPRDHRGDLHPPGLRQLCHLPQHQ
jgi:Trypsin